MPTVVKTIGSGAGRDYSSIAGWAASLPVNLVTDGNSYVGLCYNDSEFTSSSSMLTLSGHTTDASHTISLTTGAGQSFRDNADVQANALRYDPSNGVGLRTTNDIYTVQIADANVTISNLQIKCDSTGYFGYALHCGNAPGMVTVDHCILHAVSNTGGRPALSTGTGHKIRNCLIIQNGGKPPIWDGQNAILGGASFYFCTAVAPSDASPPSEAVLTGYGSPIFENCAFFGCAAVYTHNGGSSGPTFTTCMSDIASPPQGVTGGKTYASQFQNITTVSGDWRQKIGADLRGAGTSDSANGATDIAGTTRPQGGNWDIGCWEFPASGTIVISDAWGSVDLLTEQSVVRRSRCELVATQRADPRLMLELSAMRHVDHGRRLEWKASLRRDLDVADEFGSRVAIDPASFIEQLTRSLADRDVTAESVGAIISLLVAESLLPVEWSALPVAVRVSLQRLLASPGKRRILGTPGRLRLLKRD